MTVDRRPVVSALLVLVALAAPGAGRAQDANLCDVAGESPDIIVGDITNPRRWGESGGITAYSFRSDACNQGTCQAEWINSSNRHPVIAQNLFRLKDGRFEQVGQAWLKHGFATVQETTCSVDCTPAPDNQHLGVNCSDAYTSILNGNQTRMGPKFEVDPVTGIYPWPPFDYGNTGPTVISKRLQVHNVDIDPAANPGASYFVEIQYVARDDAAGARPDNNASYRPVAVSVPQPGVFDIALLDETRREQPAIRAWQASDPGVRLTAVDADGRFYVAARVTQQPNGRWRYEYAIQNLTSQSAARSFTVPVAAGTQIRNLTFHDVDYHSGEPFDGTDWAGVHDGLAGTVSWSTATFQQNPNANALRWGTLYNFGFEADHPPGTGAAAIGLFGGALGGSQVVLATLAPQACMPVAADELGCTNGVDDDCDGLDDCADLDCCTVAACQDGIDADGDHVAECDCNDGNGAVWSRPGEARNLLAAQQAGTTVLSWSAPVDDGATAVTYSALRSTSAAGFASNAVCLTLADPAQPLASDAQSPAADALFCYLVRAKNGCPGVLGAGPLGYSSANVEVAGPSCP